VPVDVIIDGKWRAVSLVGLSFVDFLPGEFNRCVACFSKIWVIS